MKMYKEVGHILSKDVNQFHKEVGAIIIKFQQLNLQVEIQYQHGPAGFSALILGY